MIDKAIISNTVPTRLPVYVRWMARDTSIDWDFSRCRSDLREPTAGDFNFEPVPDEWLILTLFGEQSVSDGGGASPLIEVHNLTGMVLGLDPESDHALFPLNSSLGQFVDTFLLFDSALRTREVEIQALVERARAIDPEGYPQSECKLIAEYVLK